MAASLSFLLSPFCGAVAISPAATACLLAVFLSLLDFLLGKYISARLTKERKWPTRSPTASARFGTEDAPSREACHAASSFCHTEGLPVPSYKFVRVAA